MCPACFTTLALTTAGGTAAGGISVLALRRLISRGKASGSHPENAVKEKQL